MKLANTVLAAVAALGLAGSAMAVGQTFEIAVNNQSWDLEGSPNNETITVDLAGLGLAPGDWVLNGVGWNVDVDPIGASWYSEVTFGLGDQGLPSALFVTPGTGDDFASTGSPINYSSDVLKFGDNGIPDIEISSGFLSIEIFESFDDVAGAPDANVTGIITLQFVPAPGALALLGMAGLVGRRRRR